ncbi:hypothetical protein TSTA_038330 [Talaromyces stipitatus ATCC 10500]|uniref:Uncharacterized protein n=1 Tax=Talaromyces stipitatus (strain ATCC 10500 / CBS 375.48 / QM 6759 / NRRL 1006) TaxID=441959 RepID=B8M8W3_TALSN|nr:uncharacterized protein TSTA_038330 [Talaromyces stipitatus ATCC 10500]EED20626.1 hypothetical protein TSTA_038330 [Talaromyces stipitatus ATCC 10500]
MSFDWKKLVPPRKLTLNEKEAQAWIKRIQSVWEFARENMKIAQDRQALQANKKRRPPNFTVNDLVVVQKVGNSFELDLPEDINVHRIFSLDKLRLASSSELLAGQLEDPSPESQVNGNSEWVVELAWARSGSQVVSGGIFEERTARLEGFPRSISGKPGPPVRLKTWLEAAEEDKFVDDHPDDDIPVTNA